jgi:hypothetical protein
VLLDGWVSLPEELPDNFRQQDTNARLRTQFKISLNNVVEIHVFGCAIKSTANKSPINLKRS